MVAIAMTGANGHTDATGRPNADADVLRTAGIAVKFPPPRTAAITNRLIIACSSHECT
jgi:hypothetical protein